MRLRQALLTITLTTLPVVALATPAHAITCPLLSDASGDSRVAAVPLYSATVDIVSADIASGTNNVAVELRVASIDDDAPSNLAPRWDVEWSINGTDYTAQVRRVVAFNSYVGEFYVNDVSVGLVPFNVNTTTDTISWTIPRTLLPDLATAGQTFDSIRAVTWVLPSAGRSADLGTTTQTYVDQTTGCITAS